MNPHPLLVIFHDPPGFKEYLDPVTGKGELHNTWLVSPSATHAVYPLTLYVKTDVNKRYIDWAVDNGFQVVDVNIPKIVSVEDVSDAECVIEAELITKQPDDEYVPSDDSAARALQTRELASYIWDNYIE